MFVGAINTDLRSIIAALAPSWKGLPVYVGCSGNFTIERILAQVGISEIHGNDVSLYSCSIGHYLAGQPFCVTLKDDRLGWLEPFLEPGLPTITTLLLCTTMMQYWDRDNPYHRRMFGAYQARFPDLHAKTLAKIKSGLDGVALRSFFAGDVVDFLTAAQAESVVISFPPTYCLAPHHRILTADLRWVACSQLAVGDRLLAFDEEPALGIRCRRWRFATVIYSQPAKKECVRVHLENGDAVICTVDHPWLADRVDSNGGGARRDWVCADRLLEHAPFVLRAVQPWESATTYEAGWLAGMFDGEGSICSSGTTRGVSWNLSLAQKEEILADRVVEVLARFGFSIGVHGRREDGMRHISVLGGVPSALAVLGTFRSLRLLRNFTKLDRQEMPSVRRHGRSRMKVTAVEPIGLHDVQSIGTSTGTYIGEGYLMHNSSGYERLYKKMDAVFDWPKPEYQLFTEERFALLIRIMQEKRVWLISKDATISSLEPYQIGLVQTGVRSKPVYVYSNQDHSTLTQPHQRLDQVPYPRVQDAIAGPLTIIPLTQGQLNTLRSEYLSLMIAPGMADRAYGVLAADHLVGAIAFSNPNRNVGDWLDVYMMSDFAVMSPIQRLSKLVLAAALSTEIGVLLEERYCCRVESIGTTAFTDKPISMKYRGLFELHSRKEGQLNYVARAGRWTLKEAFAWWTKTQSLTSTP